MDCARFQEMVHDLHRPGTQGSALRETAVAHAESCRRCAQLLSETKSLDFALRELAAKEAERQVSPRLETALVEEFRREKAVAARRRVGWPVAALGIAAAVLLALGFSMYQRSAKRGLVVEQPNQSSQPVQSTETAVQSGQTEAEDANSFVLLPYGVDPASVEEGAVVRVELSRAALASLGLSLTETGSEERVLADMVVSEDGTPQAIRLVSEESASQEF